MPENDLEAAVRRWQEVSAAIEDWRQDGETITQQDMAFLAQVAIRTAARWCQGQAEPSIRQIRKLEAHRAGLVRRLFPDAFPEG